MKEVTLRQVAEDKEVKFYLEKADEYLGMIGYTEHGRRHAEITANFAKEIMLKVGSSERESELAAIAGYLHDIGNVIERDYHAQSGALISQKILGRLGMETLEVIPIMAAIGNHEEEEMPPVNSIGASLILADKADVHYTRVKTPDAVARDIHDRVNWAAQKATLKVEKGYIILDLEIDTRVSKVMEYFEIFLSRMVACRRAAKFLKSEFELIINRVRLL
jgi:hypothetical protein